MTALTDIFRQRWKSARRKNLWRRTRSPGEAMCRILKEHIEDYALANSSLSREAAAVLMEIGTLEELLDEIPAHIPLSLENKQQIIEASTVG